ncbi:MAG: hypothetical protein IJG23_06700 [Clostridia bacterium]|nr:hypothetical protein [Clostridia bacterium]
MSDDKRYKNGEIQDNGLMYDSLLDNNNDGKVSFLEDYEMTREIDRSNSLWSGSDDSGGEAMVAFHT